MNLRVEPERGLNRAKQTGSINFEGRFEHSLVSFHHNPASTLFVVELECPLSLKLLALPLLGLPLARRFVFTRRPRDLI